MNTRVIFASLALLFGLGNAAHADIYAAGPSFGGNPAGGVATCRIINVGTSTVTIPLRQIVTNTGALLPLASDSCIAALGPNGNCAFTAAVPGNFALSCRAFVQGSDPQVSGTLDVQNPVGTVRVVTPMQNTNN
jgi:hypothetical protein